MSAVIACVVCARPLDSLLTSGLHAGVLVLAAVAVVVIVAIAHAGLRLLREDAAALAASGVSVDAGAAPPAGGRP